MEIDKNQFYRRSITPWYDADSLCWVIIILMMAVFFFAGIGLNLALSHPDFNRHIWVPSLLALLSSITCVSMIARLIQRRRRG